MADLEEMLRAAGLAGTDGSFVDPETFRSGFVTLIGRPNAGKSTLLNAVMGEKLAITSNTPQTTRHRFRAIYDSPDMQMIMVDTPGLHKPYDALSEELNTSALKALEDVDVIAMLVDCSKPVGKGDQWVAGQLREFKAKKILVISKADLGRQGQADQQLEQARQLADWDDVVVLSAKEGFNVDGFIQAVYNFLPNGPRWFPEGTGVDQPIEVLVAEFIREKILLNTRDEVPHSIGVQVEQIDVDPKTGFHRIWAVIYCERDSQKGIIIGKKGSLIKKMGTEARMDLQRLLGEQVHLDLTVKVKKNWRRDANQIRKFGYGDSAEL